MPVGGKNRFQVSLLSKKRYEEAVNEEILVDKETGEILVMRPDDRGLISYDHMARTRATVNHLSKTLDNMGLKYKIMGVDTLNPNWKKPFPRIFHSDNGGGTDNSILVDKTSTVGSIVLDVGSKLVGFKNIMFYFDIDTLPYNIPNDDKQHKRPDMIVKDDNSSYDESTEMIMDFKLMDIISHDGTKIISRLTDDPALTDNGYKADNTVTTNTAPPKAATVRSINSFIYSLTRAIHDNDKLEIDILKINTIAGVKYVLHNLFIIGINHPVVDK